MENQYEYEYEEELSLSALMLNICLKWRTLLITAIVFAVIVGGTKLAMNVQKIRDPEEVEKAKTIYEDALAGYEAEGQALEIQISESKRNLDLQTDYNDKSMLMKVDPYNEWIGSVNLYIDTGYQIMPGSTYQDENPAYKIVCAYYDYYNGGEFYTTVMDRLSFDMGELKYLKEVLGVTFDTSRYALTISVVADTKEKCEELVKTARDTFQLGYDFIKDSLGDHTLKTSDIVAYAQVNADREAYQVAQKAKESEWMQMVPELNKEYKEWEAKKGEIEVPILDTGRAVRNGIKWMIIAGAIGFFASAVIFFLKYILTGRIREAGSLGIDVRVLVELPAKGKKKNAIDRLVCRIFGVSVKESEYGSRVGAMALSLGKMLEAVQCEKGTVAFVGDVGEKELGMLVEQVARTLPKEYKAVAAGNMIVDTAAAKSAYEADAVVLVVEQDVSRRKTYDQFKDKLAACKVKVLGTVLMGVEGV